jgi:murein DD-endopeptidase MepM/ murein hydrolase activator NlpD
VRFPGRDALAATIVAVLGVALAAPLEVEVKPKDTLYSLARAHATTVEEIKRLNGLTGEALAVGQVLLVPHEEASPSPAPAAEYQTVTIEPGQTLYGLARVHGASVAEISALNGLKGEQLAVGQQIRVPSRTQAAAPVAAPAKPAAVPLPTLPVAAVATPPATAAQTAVVTPRPAVAQPKVAVAQPAPVLSAQVERPLWPMAGVLTQGYHGNHPGLDIAAPVGTPIYAALSGTVSFSGWDNTGYGMRVVVNGVDGLSYSYAHASKLLVKRGDKVAQGDLIALVGSTGRSTGPHLDFRIMRRDTSTIPPLAVLPTSRVQLASTARRNR